MAQKITQALIYAELQHIKETIQDHTIMDNNNFQELRQILEGSEAAPGMKIRLDRVEQREAQKGEKSVRQLGYLWGAVMVLMAAVLKVLFGD